MEQSGILQSALMDLSIREGRGGGQGGSSMWRVQSLVWQWAFIDLLEPWQESIFAAASSCFWTQGRAECLQQVKHKAVNFSRYVVPATFF